MTSCGCGGGRRPRDTALANVLREAVEAVEKAGYPFLVLGGLASSLVGRPRWTQDIDFMAAISWLRRSTMPGADLILYGHAHHGTEKGRTPAGIPVRNVALPVIRHAYNVYTLDARREVMAAAGGIS